MKQNAGENHVPVGTRIPAVPTILSLVRLPLAVAFAATSAPWTRIAIVAAAWASDGLDGFVARRTGMTSRAGAVLDGVTDRLFAFTVLGTFLVESALAPWHVLLLLSRDILTTIGALIIWARRVPLRLEARPLGKVVTGLQHLVVPVVLLAPAFVAIAVATVAVASAVAILDYWRATQRALRGD